MKRLPRSNWLVFLWLAALWGAVSTGWAATGSAVLTAKDSGRTLTLRVGERVVVDLNLGPGQHLISPEFDPEVLALIGQSLQSITTAKGASSRVVYEFVVQQAGQTDLVVAVTGTPSEARQAKPLLKVKIIAASGGATV
ncbi:MAG: hypothetical protein ACUVXF_01595 [Desulfobaccales bacterium]